MGRWTTEGHEGTFWGDGNVRYFDCGDGSQLCTFAKTQQKLYTLQELLPYVNFLSINMTFTKIPQKIFVKMLKNGEGYPCLLCLGICISP